MAIVQISGSEFKPGTVNTASEAYMCIAVSVCVCVYMRVCVWVHMRMCVCDSFHLDVEYSKIIVSTSPFFDELENIF